MRRSSSLIKAVALLAATMAFIFLAQWLDAQPWFWAGLVRWIGVR